MINLQYHKLSPPASLIKSFPSSILCDPAAHLDEHSKAQAFEPLQAISIRNCSLKGRDLVAFNSKFYPFWSLWPQYRKNNLANEIRQVISICIRCSHEIISIPGISCSLASHPCWEKNIFHWFLDLLPRVFAAEFIAQFPSKVNLLKPDRLLDWQQESLEILGYKTSSLIILPSSSSLSVTAESFVTLLNSRSSQSARLSFRTHPYIIKTLKQRFSSVKANTFSLNAKRIFILRDPRVGRGFQNVNEIQDFLHANNFVLIELSSLTLSSQIQLFQNASHVIGAHGAGLTHIIHCSNASIMEIHCSSHRIRSDYFQIAAINSLRYFYHVCSPVNANNDMVLDIQVLREFLVRSSD
jgi:hypothetical protein